MNSEEAKILTKMHSKEAKELSIEGRKQAIASELTMIFSMIKTFADLGANSVQTKINYHQNIEELQKLGYEVFAVPLAFDLFYKIYW